MSTSAAKSEAWLRGYKRYDKKDGVISSCVSKRKLKTRFCFAYLHYMDLFLNFTLKKLKIQFSSRA